MSTFTKYKVGLHNVGSYQVSGKPWVTGAIDLSAFEDQSPLKLTFPFVTNWVVVSNNATTATETVKIGFSGQGLVNENLYFEVVGAGGISPKLEVKATQLFLTGSSTNVSIMAGLTFIDTNTIDNSNVSTIGKHKNWTGSVGI